MKLKELLKGFESKIQITGDENFLCQNLTANSREVRPGSLFVALKGEAVDGHRFIEDALQRGASAVLCEALPSDASRDVTWIQCVDTKNIFPFITKRYFGDPASKLRLIGVTGTNGKTTTTYLLEYLLAERGGSLLVGTVEYRLRGKRIPSNNTTPGIFELTTLMREAVEQKLSYGIFEVSSHALKQGRLKGLEFQTAIFTNLTQDHLDYHPTFEDYFESKQKLFVENHPQYSVINIDDPYGLRLMQTLLSQKTHLITYSAKGTADSKASNIQLNSHETTFDWHVEVEGIKKTLPVRSSLICQHSVYNLLAAMTAAHIAGLTPEEIVERIQSFRGVPGRMERSCDNLPFSVFVDYAHSPDAFKNVLHSVRYLVPRGGSRILTVFGCGGDRDKKKRPLMGALTEEYSDEVILTSDNPRTEDAETILNDIARALKKPHHRIADRKEAIHTALRLAQPGDVVLILGKGHEDYQIFGTQKVHFSDQEVVREWAQALV